jgi:D-alanyl-D-alanine carboxypeptidase
MTALIILDKYSLDDVFTVKSVITDGRVMNLVQGEKLTVESLLYGTLVHSANDAAYALAENYPGGVQEFVNQMNKKAKELGLNNTNFTNPVGFDDPNHYTTANDLVALSVYAFQNKTIDKIVSTKSITVSDTTYTYFHELHNVNQLLGKVAGIAGLKTGYTQNAGEVLISVVKKNGESVLFAVLKSADRFGETEKLIDWVFNNFKWLH